jgi:hypothetical protein
VGFYLVVFGAAIREDGSPTPTLRRRCENAVTFSRRFMMPYFLATGGAGSRGKLKFNDRPLVAVIRPPLETSAGGRLGYGLAAGILQLDEFCGRRACAGASA